ncbi:ABC transporter ATPase [Ferrovum myxofaciens]|uniref:ABC transporter ATPase n=1 Tax=Ferrovum myxofaciens TaxID=416213 RepID=A0A9E6SX34_9PROT|nr:ABC transporter ATPase [Ferrovum myxofaciens]QSH81860.1 MAG: ABC transporter ATPase [Ferrovum myxofaciens]QWY74206.1 MAG: ABC transporter ATPase [Ferrovum myxofaciens]QWY76958.1 MAG: ABC transporter ATPase [Ferrovum myxofaciens]
MKSGTDLPTTTVTQARVRLFQPTQRPVHRQGDWVDTSWGRCRVIGRLGQRHADLWEAVFFCAVRSKKTDGRLELLVDPAAIRSCLSDRGYSGGQVNKLLDEISAALVSIETGGWRGEGHLIDSHFKSKVTKFDPLTGGERFLVVVKVGDAGMAFIKNDVKKWRDPAPIARLVHGVSQAVARLVLSHRETGRVSIESALDAVGVSGGQAVRDARRRLSADVGALLDVGVVVEGGYIFAEKRSRPRTESVALPPDGVAHSPGGVAHPPDSLGILEPIRVLRKQKTKPQI